MTTFEGEQLAADGIALATAATPALSIEQAYDIIKWCAMHHEFFDADTVHERIEGLGLPDLSSPGAWGGLYRRAERDGVITRVHDSSRWRKSKRPQQHAKLLPLYKSQWWF